MVSQYGPVRVQSAWSWLCALSNPIDGRAVGWIPSGWRLAGPFPITDVPFQPWGVSGARTLPTLTSGYCSWGFSLQLGRPETLPSGGHKPPCPFPNQARPWGITSCRAGPVSGAERNRTISVHSRGTPNAFFTSPTIAGSCTLLLLTDTRTPLCGIPRPPPRLVSKNENVDFGFALDGACPRYACAMEMVKAKLTIERDIEIFRRSREATSCNAGCSRPQVRHIGSGAHYPGATAK